MKGLPVVLIRLKLSPQRSMIPNHKKIIAFSLV